MIAIYVKKEPVDLKELVGQFVWCIGQQNAWKRGRSVWGNITKYKVLSAGPKNAKIAIVSDDGDIGYHGQNVARKSSDTGSHDMGFNSSVLIFTSEEQLKDWVQVNINAQRLSVLFQPYRRNLPKDFVNKAFAAANEAGLLKQEEE